MSADGCAHVPARNRLLAALPAETIERWSDSLELVELHAGEILSRPQSAAACVWFPLDCILSLIMLTHDGGSTEVASIGQEGLLGASLFLSGNVVSHETMVSSAGLAYRLKARLVIEEFNRCPAARRLLMRYLESLLMQSAQVAVCNRHHTVEQQLCRWLLAALDHNGGAELCSTQELIANALGVRRTGIAEAMGRLRRAGLLQCRRGRIAVIDRARLELRACECYEAIRTEIEQVLSSEAERSTLASPAHRAITVPRVLALAGSPSA